MMLGIAASISIAVPSGRRSHTGESSVRNTAMPKLTGIAIVSAMKLVPSVPTMGTSAPNSSRTGSHSSVQRNSTPKCLMEGAAPIASDTRIAASRLNTRNAKNRVRFRNNASISALFRSIGGFGDRSRTIAGDFAIAKPLLSSTAVIAISAQRLARRVRDTLPRRLDLLHDRVGHRHVVELLGHLAAVAVSPIEEFEDFAPRF